MSGISDGQYIYLKRRINDLESALNDLKSKVDDVRDKRKRWLTFDEAVPPKSVCRDALSMIEGVQYYTGVLRCLSEYYGLESRMELLHDPAKVPKGAIACYYRGTGKAYAKNPVSMNTVLHEFFHFLCDQGVVYLHKGQDEEELAATFAQAVFQRGQMP